MPVLAQKAISLANPTVCNRFISGPSQQYWANTLHSFIICTAYMAGTVLPSSCVTAENASSIDGRSRPRTIGLTGGADAEWSQQLAVANCEAELLPGMPGNPSGKLPVAANNQSQTLKVFSRKNIARLMVFER